MRPRLPPVPKILTKRIRTQKIPQDHAALLACGTQRRGDGGVQGGAVGEGVKGGKELVTVRNFLLFSNQTIPFATNKTIFIISFISQYKASVQFNQTNLTAFFLSYLCYQKKVGCNLLFVPLSSNQFS